MDGDELFCHLFDRISERVCVERDRERVKIGAIFSGYTWNQTLYVLSFAFKAYNLEHPSKLTVRYAVTTLQTCIIKHKKPIANQNFFNQIFIEINQIVFLDVAMMKKFFRRFKQTAPISMNAAVMMTKSSSIVFFYENQFITQSMSSLDQWSNTSVTNTTTSNSVTVNEYTTCSSLPQYLAWNVSLSVYVRFDTHACIGDKIQWYKFSFRQYTLLVENHRNFAVFS